MCFKILFTVFKDENWKINIKYSYLLTRRSRFLNLYFLAIHTFWEQDTETGFLNN